MTEGSGKVDHAKSLREACERFNREFVDNGSLKAFEAQKLCSQLASYMEEIERSNSQ